MGDKSEDKVKSPRGRRSSQPPQKTATIASGTDDAIGGKPVKKRRSAVFDTSKLSTALGEEAKKDGETPKKKTKAGASSGAAGGMRRSLSGGSLKVKSTVNQTGEPGDDASSAAASSTSRDSFGRVSQLKQHARIPSAASDSSMTGEEIQIMGITVSTKVKKAKSVKLEGDKTPSTKDNGDSKDTETKKPTKKKAVVDAESDTHKDGKKETDPEKKSEAEGPPQNPDFFRSVFPA